MKFNKLALRPAIIFLAIMLSFFASRFWVLNHPPAEYSDVKQDYERYANIWRYGLTPYLEHLYEYPPATIPVVYLPLELDQRGIGKYYANYRAEIFVIESLMFMFVIVCLWKSAISKKHRVLALSYYLIAGMVAKDFWYEGIDLIFFGSIACLLAWIRISDQGKFTHRVATWTIFWFSVAVKLITFPLAVPIFLLTKIKKLQHEVLASVLGGAIVWGIPVLFFRSSLSVFIIFHAKRPLKFGAFGSYIIELINDFAKTEQRVQVGPDYPMAGPVSAVVTKIVSILFLLAISMFILWSWKVIRNFLKKNVKRNANTDFFIMISLTLTYIFIFFLSSKTFSSPFHIWYIPLFAMYPFASLSSQVFVYLSGVLLLLLDTTPHLKAPAGVIFDTVPLYHLRDAFRFIPMIFLAVFFAQRLKLRRFPQERSSSKSLDS